MKDKLTPRPEHMTLKEQRSTLRKTLENAYCQSIELLSASEKAPLEEMYSNDYIRNLHDISKDIFNLKNLV